ncbi:MAG: dienelactone hydrolase [Chitinophagaceae bacterium]
MNRRLLLPATVFSVLFFACNNKKNSSNTTNEATMQPQLKEETVTYTADSVTMKGYVVYDENNKDKRPAVLVVHEWWGQTDYPRTRAKQLAELGYVAMAVDMYGDGKTVEDPQSAQNLAMPFYQNPQMAKTRFDAAVNKLKELNVVDTNNIAAIGYCFGGGVLLNVARMGEPLKGVVSFHGSLLGTAASKDLLKAKILVCHGNADPFVPKQDVDRFKKQMDSIGADYTFKGYDGATHAFTNPAATEKGKKYNLPIAYNAAADSASWNDMKDFFNRIFK